MSSQDWILIGVAAAVSVVLLWWERRRRSRRNLTARLVAVLAAMLALVMLGVKASRNDGVRIALLRTEGARDTSFGTEVKQYTKDSYLASADTAVGAWYINGYGLTDAELLALKPAIAGHYYSLPDAGIAAASWPLQTTPGKPWQVQGQVRNRTGNTLTLSLEAYAQVQDSITIAPGENIAFELRAGIKHAGRALFRLRLSEGNKVIEDNPVPVEVVLPTHLKLLVLAASPDFEYRFLQRWLGENGFSAVVRTRVSRDIYQQTYINRSPAPVGRLTSGALDSFDVVLADATELADLATYELTALRQQVSDKGLGLLVRADTLPGQAFYANGYRFRNVVPGQSQQVAPIISLATDSLKPLPTESFSTILPDERQQPLVAAQGGYLLATASLYGRGKTAVSTLPNAYQWQLSGEDASYAAYWTALLTSLAPQEGNASRAVPRLIIVTPGEQSRLAWVSERDSLVLRVNDTVLVHASRNAYLPHLWRGDYWADTNGWVTVDDGLQQTSRYVYHPKDWPLIQALQRIEATTTWAAQHPGAGPTMLAKTGGTLWWFLLFLAAVVFLWVERKFFS